MNFERVFYIIYYITNKINQPIEFLLIAILLNKCFLMKPKVKQKKLVTFSFILVAMLAEYLLSKAIHVGFTEHLLITVSIAFSYSMLFMEGKIYTKLFLITSLVTTNLICRIAVSKLIHCALPWFRDSLNTRIISYISTSIVNIICYCLLFFITWVFIKNFADVEFKLSAKYWIFMLVIVIYNFCVTMCLRSVHDYTIVIWEEFNVTMTIWVIVAIMANSIIVILALYYLFNKLAEEYHTKTNYKLVNQQLNLQKNYIKETTEMYDNIRIIRHELKNNILCINMMIENNKIDDLKKYCGELCSTILDNTNMIETGNRVVNAILTQKVSRAKSLNIPIDIKAYLPETIGIVDYDLCAVISNMVDNALEASEHVLNPYVNIEIKVIKSYITILVRNRIENDVLKDNPSLNTTKKDKHNHGIGIKVIYEIVNKYNGMDSFTVENAEFIASVMLTVNNQN